MKPLLFICLTMLVFSCVSGHRDPFPKDLPPERDLSTLELRLKSAVDTSDSLSIQEIGRVSYNGFQAPLWLVNFRAEGISRQHILINAGIHGNEPAGVECAVRFVEYLSHHPERYAGQTIDLIPVVNPWGWTHDIRYNQEGIDINRDLASLKSQESKLLKQYVEKKQYDLMFDLHEDPSAEGFYLYQYAQKDKAQGAALTQEVSRMGYPLEQNVRMAILKTKDGIIDAPMWGLWYVNFTRQLSLANYYRLHNSKNVFTIETPTSMEFSERVHLQETAVNLLIEHFGKE